MAISVFHDPFHHDGRRFFQPLVGAGAQRRLFSLELFCRRVRIALRFFLGLTAQLAQLAVGFGVDRLDGSLSGALSLGDQLFGAELGLGDRIFRLGFRLGNACNRFL